MYPLSKESSASIKGQNTNKIVQCPLQKESSKPEIAETLGPPSKSSNTESCLKLTNLVKREDVSSNVTFIERNIKTPIKTKFVSGSFNEKTPAIQLYTPKQTRINTPSANTKFNVLSTARTPVKRYFSDHALSQSTPDCFNVVHLETPSQKIDDIVVGEQTMYDGESSNLTVGIRIRPLNSK